MQPNDLAAAQTSRRTFLRSACAGVAVTGLIGTATGIEDQYRTVIDVADAGADRSGSESVSPLLADLIGDDTLLKFPPGEYYMDEQVRESGADNVGLVGDDATLVPADYYDFDGPQYRLFRLGTYYDPARDVLIKNFDVDQRADDTGIRAFHVSVSDGLSVKNIDVIGRHDSGTWGPALFRVTDSDGSGHIDGLRITDGADWQTQTPGDLWRGPTGILINNHDGSIRLDHCVVRNYPDNGLYVTGSGSVSVVGGLFQNNGPVNVRIGASRATVERTEFVTDQRSPYYLAQIPMRFDYADRVVVRDVSIDLTAPNGDAVQILDDVESAALRNTDIDIADVPAAGVVVKSGSGPVSIVDVDVDMDCSANAFRLLGNGGGVVVQDCRIAGSASGENLRHAIRCERDNCEFRALTVDQWGGGKRRGIALLGEDYTVYKCRIRCSDRPVSAYGDDIWIEENYLDSYSGDESIRIGPDADSVRIKNNELPDGIQDAGGRNVLVTGTTY
ncbi:hypothetical protein GCM10009030_20300 [Haloarcula pellucida]|uniref:Right handed beta helix region n=2 Tax=Haloarcula pellucida TaxID=1427151 RepID=A0A830GM00_9EURY|nr:hypothetical protein GCM10009030_20300 [Halomicroarcula pellucida]